MKILKRLWKFFDEVLLGPLVVITFIIAIVGGIAWWNFRSKVYDFGNGARLEVPFGVTSVDMKEKGNGIFVEAGANVTVTNSSGEWRTLTVSFRSPGERTLHRHAFEDMPPHSSKTFGAEPHQYEGMHVSVSDFAQRKRDKEK